MNRVGDQLLAGSGFAAQQHRRIGPRDLGNLLVHLAHRAAGADEVREIVALLEFLPEMGVLVDQALLLGLDQPMHLDRLGDHRSDHAEKLHRAGVVAFRFETQIDANRANCLVIEGDRCRDIRELFLR